MKLRLAHTLFQVKSYHKKTNVSNPNIFCGGTFSR